MVSARSELLQRLLRGVDPFCDFPSHLIAPDEHGWNSNHVYLADSVAKVCPRVVIEIGVWLGGSSRSLARALREHSPQGALICVDTWLGSTEHWAEDNLFQLLCTQNAQPQIYKKFLANMMHANLADLVIPMPIESTSAAGYLKHCEVRAQIIHIDAAHDFISVSNDLRLWWPLLDEGGIMIADDYHASGQFWPDVKRAVDEFVVKNSVEGFEAADGKCRFVKARS